MKRIFTLGASIALAITMAGTTVAQTPMMVDGKAAVREVAVKAANLRQANTRQLKSNSLPMTFKANNKLQATMQAAPQKATGQLGDGLSLWESFEGWDTETLPWMPEGWTLDSKSGRDGTDLSTWTPAEALPYTSIGPVEGETMMAINYGDTPQDEWLVSPTFTVGENHELKFFAYIHPLYLFNVDDIDWDILEFAGGRKVVCTVKVLVKEEGADWVEIWDASTKWMDVSTSDLLYSTPNGLEQYVVPMDAYVGKNVQIAFQYVGSDGDTVCLDMVSVGLPSLEGLTYDNPAEILYWGSDSTWLCLGSSVVQFPACAPLTWSNLSDIPGAAFGWEYMDPETSEWISVGGSDDLTLEYLSDHTEAYKTRPFPVQYEAPILNGRAAGAQPGTYQNSYVFQAGGDAVLCAEETYYKFNLAQFSVAEHGFSVVTKEAEFGNPSTPIFGYDKNADSWWLNYTYNGDTTDIADTDHVYVEAIMNRLITGTGPLVIKGVSVLALGKVTDDAEFKIEIIRLDDDNVPMVETPIATAICKGKDVHKMQRGTEDRLSVMFTFDSPITIMPGDNDHMLRFSGFHDPVNVEYFAPVQSVYPFTHMNVIGWIDKLIRIQGESEYRRSYTPTFYMTSDYGMCHNAFAIELDAYHPWLLAEETEIEVVDDGQPVEVALNSYYDGSLLAIEAPEGVQVTATGRYGDCKLVVTCTDANVSGSSLKVSAPGVEKIFTIKASAGVESLVCPDLERIPVGAYTLAGQSVDIEKAAKGVYIVKYSDGTAAKVYVK